VQGDATPATRFIDNMPTLLHHVMHRPLHGGGEQVLGLASRPDEHTLLTTALILHRYNGGSFGGEPGGAPQYDGEPRG
jgi:hypothetical protein